MYIEYIIVATNYYLINTSFSSLALAIRLCRWLKMTPAFENNRSTGAELQGTDNNCTATVSFFVLSRILSEKVACMEL